MENKTVYSTDPDWKPAARQEKQDSAKVGKQTAYLRLERKGRGGKAVTVVAGLKGNLKSLQKELQKHCGTGGSLKNGQIELQGDHRKKAADFLLQKGFKSKMSGG